MTTGPRPPHLYIGDDGRLRMMIDESTLFGKITIAMVQGWTSDNLRPLYNQMDVTAQFWNESTLETRSEVIGRLVDALWLKAAQERLMMVAMGRPRWGAVTVEMPAHMLPPVTERTPFPEGAQRMTISLRAYAMSPAATDLNM